MCSSDLIAIIWDPTGRRECVMKTMFKRFMSNENGATAIEYGLIASLIAAGIITGVTLVGTNLAAKFTSIAASLT